MSDKKIHLQKDRELEIPVMGSLGLLALGHKGVIAWRKVRNEAQQKTSTEKG